MNMYMGYIKMIDEIIITYCESNKKYDLFVNGDRWGKFSSISECLTSITKRLDRFEERYKDDD